MRAAARRTRTFADFLKMGDFKREERAVRNESRRPLDGVGLCPWERGRPARNAALTRGDTLILAFSHKGRRDLSLAIHT